jgi:tetratricopeptide (TPR) repeat protein
MAFAHIEAGLLEQAEHYLSLLTSAFHKEPYPTATLGLFHFRKGHYDRAEQLYDEAVSLSPAVRDKARIRQKFNLEMAKRYLDGEPQRAARFLDRVVSAKDGDAQLASIAGAMKKRLQGTPKG